MHVCLYLCVQALLSAGTTLLWPLEGFKSPMLVPGAKKTGEFSTSDLDWIFLFESFRGTFAASLSSALPVCNEL